MGSSGGIDVQASTSTGSLHYRTTGTPSPLSPTPSPAGSVGSVGSQSSGYSSGELAPNGGAGPGGVQRVSCPLQQQQQHQQQQQQQQQQTANQAAVAAANAATNLNGPCVSVPLAVHSVMQKQNQYSNYLFTCHELWEQADNLVYKVQAEGNIHPHVSVATLDLLYMLLPASSLEHRHAFTWLLGFYCCIVLAPLLAFYLHYGSIEALLLFYQLPRRVDAARVLLLSSLLLPYHHFFIAIIATSLVYPLLRSTEK